VDQAHTENEWVLRAYTRSTKKAKLADDEDGGDEA
jgi:U3 small nucleolar ribonucleoprotein protein IMP4